MYYCIDHVLEVVLVRTVHENHALLGSSNTHPRDIGIYIIFHVLEDCWRISEAEWHDRILEVPIS